MQLSRPGRLLSPAAQERVGQLQDLYPAAFHRQPDAALLPHDVKPAGGRAERGHVAAPGQHGALLGLQAGYGHQAPIGAAVGVPVGAPAGAAAAAIAAPAMHDAAALAVAQPDAGVGGADAVALPIKPHSGYAGISISTCVSLPGKVLRSCMQARHLCSMCFDRCVCLQAPVLLWHGWCSFWEACIMRAVQQMSLHISSTASHPRSAMPICSICAAL